MARRALRVAAAVLVLAITAAGAWFYAAAFADRSAPRGATMVVVPSGATGRETAALLAARHVIGSALAFEILARFEGKAGAVRAGEFRFLPHQSVAEILRDVTGGSQEVAVWVTFPEGLTAKEMARTLAARGLGSEAAFAAEFLHRSLEVDGTRTRSLEGFLFPDTYLFSLGVTPRAVADAMSGEFLRKLPPDARARAARLGLNVAQVVTLASLVEREAKADDERALIAGVYYNRLRLHMPLQVDATIEYTFSHHNEVITYADLARDSPYNTYLRLGLPPTPIANPGAASLAAAFFPRASQYLYYVAMGNGRHAFSRTLDEHDANVARYLH